MPRRDGTTVWMNVFWSGTSSTGSTWPMSWFCANVCFVIFVAFNRRNVRRARADAPAEDRGGAGARARRAGLVTIAKGLLRDVGWLMGLALFVEASFSLPGLGRALELATFSADTPVMESVLIFGTLVAFGIHLLGTLIGGAVSAKWRAGA